LFCHPVGKGICAEVPLDDEPRGSGGVQSVKPERQHVMYRWFANAN
jgi:hypothetical protein